MLGAASPQIPCWYQIHGGSTIHGSYVPETASDQPVLARHDPMRLGNFLYKARFFLEKDENKGRNFFALGKALVACGAARACKNFDDKDDFQVINERSVRLALVQWCRDEQYGLQHFRYAH